MLPDPLPSIPPARPPDRRVDGRLAHVVHIGAAMIPAYGTLRAARFMSARGVPACLLVPLLRLGDRRRRRDAARAWSTLPWKRPSSRPARSAQPAARPEDVTAASAG